MINCFVPNGQHKTDEKSFIDIPLQVFTPKSLVPSFQNTNIIYNINILTFTNMVYIHLIILILEFNDIE